MRLGADPDVTDERFGATPLGRAGHVARQPLVDLPEPVTAPTPDDAGGDPPDGGGA